MKYYIGLSLAASSSVDTGVAIIDDFNNIIPAGAAIELK